MPLLEDDDIEHDHRNQRRRQEAPPPGTSIKRKLLELAEDVNGRELGNSKDSAVEIARLAADNWEDEYVRDVFVNIVLKL
jgi:nuclear cap-binding protein subunit 1